MRVIKTKDLMIMRGVNLRTAKKDMQKIKDYFDKQEHQLITNYEAAEYYGLDDNDFESIINSQLS
jgi:hypothetical protein